MNILKPVFDNINLIILGILLGFYQTIETFIKEKQQSKPSTDLAYYKF
jgi:hypothetical protein